MFGNTLIMVPIKCYQITHSPSTKSCWIMQWYKKMHMYNGYYTSPFQHTTVQRLFRKYYHQHSHKQRWSFFGALVSSNLKELLLHIFKYGNIFSFGFLWDVLNLLVFDFHGFSSYRKSPFEFQCTCISSFWLEVS